MWGLTVGCERPEGSIRSQAQTSSASAEAMKLRSRRRIGSESAANDRASVSAVASSSISARTGVQQAIGSRTAAALAMGGLYRHSSKKSIDSRRSDAYVSCIEIRQCSQEAFPMSRVQLALNVEDLDASIAFYTKLFQTPPAK